MRSISNTNHPAPLESTKTMHAERWLFENNIDPRDHAKIQKKLRALAQDLKAQCLFGAIAHFPIQ